MLKGNGKLLYDRMVRSVTEPSDISLAASSPLSCPIFLPFPRPPLMVLTRLWTKATVTESIACKKHTQEPGTQCSIIRQIRLIDNQTGKRGWQDWFTKNDGMATLKLVHTTYRPKPFSSVPKIFCTPEGGLGWIVCTVFFVVMPHFGKTVLSTLLTSPYTTPRLWLYIAGLLSLEFSTP